MPSIAESALSRHGARRPLVRRAHRRRPRVPASACCRRCVERGGVDDAFVARAHDRLRGGARRRARRRTGTRSSARAARRASASRRFARLLIDAAERDLRLVDGAHAARARRRHRQGAGQRRPRARPAGRPEQRARADPRPLGRAGRRRGRLRARASTPRRARAGPSVWGFAVPDDAGLDGRRDGRRTRAAATSTLFWMVGGNFLETLPDAARPRAALRAAAPAHPPGHRALVVDAGRARRRRAAAAGDDALRIAGRRHRDLDRAAHHLLARDPGPAHRIGAAGVVGVPRGDGARASRTRAHLVGFDDAAAIRARDRARGAALRRHRDAVARKGDQVQWGGRAPLRRRPLRHARRHGALRAGRARAAARCPAIASSSRRAAASSSTRWCSATSIRSPAPTATTS